MAAEDTEPTSSPMPSGSTRPVSTPRAASTDTPRDASAFITTTSHSPPSGSKVAAWRPGPLADAAQNACSAGGAGARSPGWRSRVAPKGA
jgi:hypothetical protein